jgi:hypothetical protein
MNHITYADVQAYLDAIANKANNDISNSPHDRFWNVPYNEFVSGTVPHTKCNGQAIPLINHADPINSAFYLILTDTSGWCNKREMPGGGPFITDTGYQVTLANGSTITGNQIKDNIASWLSNGFPES